jgi:hypothetical protein
MKLQDVLHFYIGCKFGTIRNGKGGMLVDRIVSACPEQRIIHSSNWEDFNYEDIKPILRPLSSLTDEEMKDLYCCDVWALAKKKDITKIGFDGGYTNCIWMEYTGQIDDQTGSRNYITRFYLNHLSSYHFQWLISRGFDVFNLINQGHALNAQDMTGGKEG